MIRAHPSVAHERVVAPGLAQRMTCSDKIAKWNALGLQVCITVQVPVYVNHHFDISAVGSRVHCCQGGSSHCSCRQQRLGASSLDHTVSVLCVADCRTSCQAQCRNLQGHSGASDIRHSCARKSSWTPERSVQPRGGGARFSDEACLSWSRGDSSAEPLDGRQGFAVPDGPSSVPRVCKRSLLQAFRSLSSATPFAVYVRRVGSTAAPGELHAGTKCKWQWRADLSRGEGCRAVLSAVRSACPLFRKWKCCLLQRKSSKASPRAEEPRTRSRASWC